MLAGAVTMRSRRRPMFFVAGDGLAATDCRRRGTGGGRRPNDAYIARVVMMVFFEARWIARDRLARRLVLVGRGAVSGDARRAV